MLEARQELIQRLKTLHERACPIPWERWQDLPCCGVETPDCCLIHSQCSTGQIGPHTDANYELLVTLRNALPEILAYLEG